MLPGSYTDEHTPARDPVRQYPTVVWHQWPATRARATPTFHAQRSNRSRRTSTATSPAHSLHPYNKGAGVTPCTILAAEHDLQRLNREIGSLGMIRVPPPSTCHTATPTTRSVPPRIHKRVGYLLRLLQQPRTTHNHERVRSHSSLEFALPHAPAAYHKNHPMDESPQGMTLHVFEPPPTPYDCERHAPSSPSRQRRPHIISRCRHPSSSRAQPTHVPETRGKCFWMLCQSPHP